MSRKAIDAVLEQFLSAWQSGDAEAVANLFAPDGVYAASVGPEPGERATGREAIHSLVKRIFEFDADSETRIIRRVPTQHGAFWLWECRLPNGSVEIGCDLVVVEDGLVALKDAYRKVKA